MHSINPFWTLWGPLAALGVAVPIVIHLLSRYRSRQMDWAAMELLKRAMVVRSRRLRLEDLILLLLRCAAAALIALALARPVLTEKGFGTAGEGAPGVLIALDGSYSMAHKPGMENSRFGAALKRGQDVLDTVKAGAPVTLVVMGNRPHVIVRDKAFDPEAFKEELKKIEPLPESLDLEACLREIARMMQETKAGTRECYIITDAQASTWGEVSSAAKARLKNLQEGKDGCRVFLLPAGSKESRNLAISRLSVGSGVLRTGSTAMYVAQVENTGPDMQTGVTVQLFVTDAAGKPVAAGAAAAGGKSAKRGPRLPSESLGQMKDERVLDRIGSRESVAVPLFVRFETAGLYTVTARIKTAGRENAGDGLAIDDIRYAVADIRNTAKVLCVDGEPSPEPFRGETDFLAAALSCQGSVGGDPTGGAGLNLKVVPAGGFEVNDLGNYDAVFLANVPEVSRFQALALDEYVRRGGGLVVFLGGKVIGKEFNSQMLGRNGVPILPGTIGARRGKAAGKGVADKSGSGEGWLLSPDRQYHPITGVFERMRKEHWSAIRFQEYFRVDPAADAQVLLRLAPGNDPLLLERTLGRGKVVLFASTADRDWNDLVVYPAYLMMMQQTVTHLTRKAHETPHLVADKLVLDLPADAPADVRVRVGEPAEAAAGPEDTIRVSQRDGQKIADTGTADRPGIYTVSWPNCAAPIKAAVNVDPRESTLAVLRDKDLQTVAKKLNLWLIDEQQNVQAEVEAGRRGREIWFTLLMIALAALAVEALLGRLFSRRMNRGAEPLPTAARAGL